MRSITVTAATPVVLTSGGDSTHDHVSLAFPATIAAIPGAGGTILVEYQLVKDGSWTNWPDGAVGAKTISVLGGPVYALRFTAAVDTATVEISS